MSSTTVDMGSAGTSGGAPDPDWERPVSAEPGALTESGQPKALNVGGSALIRGVMMGVEGRIGVAARTPEGEIVSELLHTAPAPSRIPTRIRRAWGLRGVLGVGAGLGRSLGAMRWSTVIQGAPKELMASKPMTLLLVSSIIAGASMFSLLPYLAFAAIEQRLGAGMTAVSVETVLRLGMIVGYMWLVGKRASIAETFAYHGAEHVSVSCYESELPLRPENAALFSTSHPRCGTNFTFLVMAGVSVIGILTASIGGFSGAAIRFAGVFVAAGLSYELMKWCSERMEWRVCAVLMAPGLALQKLTTKTPSLDQIEVAIVALETALRPEHRTELRERIQPENPQASIPERLRA